MEKISREQLERLQTHDVAPKSGRISETFLRSSFLSAKQGLENSEIQTVVSVHYLKQEVRFRLTIKRFWAEL